MCKFVRTDHHEEDLFFMEESGSHKHIPPIPLKSGEQWLMELWVKHIASLVLSIDPDYNRKGTVP